MPQSSPEIEKPRTPPQTRHSPLLALSCKTNQSQTRHMPWRGLAPLLEPAWQLRCHFKEHGLCRNDLNAARRADKLSASHTFPRVLQRVQVGCDVLPPCAVVAEVVRGHVVFTCCVPCARTQARTRAHRYNRTGTRKRTNAHVHEIQPPLNQYLKGNFKNTRLVLSSSLGKPPWYGWWIFSGKALPQESLWLVKVLSKQGVGKCIFKLELVEGPLRGAGRPC